MAVSVVLLEFTFGRVQPGRTGVGSMAGAAQEDFAGQWCLSGLPSKRTPPVAKVEMKGDLSDLPSKLFQDGTGHTAHACFC